MAGQTGRRTKVATGINFFVLYMHLFMHIVNREILLFHSRKYQSDFGPTIYKSESIRYYLPFIEIVTKGDIGFSLLTYHQNHPLQTDEES